MPVRQMGEGIKRGGGGGGIYTRIWSVGPGAEQPSEDSSRRWTPLAISDKTWSDDLVVISRCYGDKGQTVRDCH